MSDTSSVEYEGPSLNFHAEATCNICNAKFDFDFEEESLTSAESIAVTKAVAQHFKSCSGDQMKALHHKNYSVSVKQV